MNMGMKTKGKHDFMAKEIERKFLVTDIEAVRQAAVKSYPIRQAYLSDNPDATVRIRIKGEKAYLTVKGRNRGAVRDEWEYEIPVEEATEMADKLCGGFAIDKTRYIVPLGDLLWEIDEFHGRHQGLILAEVELSTEKTEISSLPSFIAAEVTSDPRYYNSTLARALS